MIFLPLVTICLIATHAVHAIPKPDEPLPGAAHGHSAQHSSHLNSDKHDTQYDHEQFLGEDQAKTFDELAPEESRRRLG